MIELATDRRGGELIAFDGSKSRCVAIFGKRGSGKSYTLGRIVEEYHRQREHLIVVVDPLAVYWSTAIPLDNEEPIPVKVCVPGPPERALGPLQAAMESYGVEVARLWLNPDDISPDGWCQFFSLELNEPMGICLFRAVHRLQEAGGHWGIPDIIFAIQDDELAADKTKQALENRLRMARTWGVFADRYTDTLAVLDPGRVNIIDVSAFEPGPQSIRNLAVKLLVEQLFRARFESRRAETLGQPGSIPPILLAIDEAHNYCPGNLSALARPALIRWAKEGRQPGLSLAVATQQPSALDFDLISQVDLLIIHHLTLGDDIKVVARLAAAYAEDLPAYLKGVRWPGEAVIVDDATERVVVGKVLPRRARHGGGEALAAVGAAGAGGSVGPFGPTFAARGGGLRFPAPSGRHRFARPRPASAGPPAALRR